nr:MAG TPA: hypothetical protein [Bacteriophage sp.]
MELEIEITRKDGHEITKEYFNIGHGGGFPADPGFKGEDAYKITTNALPADLVDAAETYGRDNDVTGEWYIGSVDVHGHTTAHWTNDPGWAEVKE